MISPERFDGALLWQTLSMDEQAAIGAAALELFASQFCQDETYDGAMVQTPEGRASDAANLMAHDVLERAIAEAVPTDLMTDGEDLLKLPSCIDAVCRECGCSQNDACPGRCAWAEPDLCTACKANAGSGVSAPEPAS